MEPLAAVALAGNVLQFAEFVGRLFKDASKIYTSASGLTPDDHHIQDICNRLGSFSIRLRVTASDPNTPLDKDLQACVATCKKDCDDLLSIMKVLAAKTSKPRKYWKSFSAALSHKLKEGEIEGLRSRIKEHQNLISLQLLKMLKFVAPRNPLNSLTHVYSESFRAISNEVLQLRSTITDWTAGTAAWLDRLFDTQQGLGKQIQTLSKQIKTPNCQCSISIDAVDNICSGLRGLSIGTQNCQQTMNILNSLDYEERPIRHSVIPKAHKATFAWALRQEKPGEDQRSSGSFHRWLSEDSDLFWVSGKPGSGKSTFMKFVADHKETRKCLQQWAGHGELVLASHFFTIYGTTIQRSLEGLLRSLLHNILEGEPKLMPKLLPTRWTNTSVQPRWTQSELESALRDVAGMNMSVRMCFFIDGLDEYSGDHLEICQTLKELSRPPSIKVCVSSRPWNVFEDAFGNSRESKLYMHELTHDDILNYTQARLSEHPRWSFVSSGPDAAALQSLIHEVVDRSMGVFLWVFLVTQLLREGLSNGDKSSDLERRVSRCPDDLGEFFKHILASVDSFYHEKMAGTLMVARDAGESLPTDMFRFHECEYDDEDYALYDPADHEWRNDDHQEASNTVCRRINGWCKGLLEPQDGKMVFLHRTVFDFLQTPEMVTFLQEKAKANFCSHLSLLRAWLACFKRTAFVQKFSYKPDLMEDLPELVQTLRQGIRYASMASREGGDIEVAAALLLDNADLGIIKMARRTQILVPDESMAVGIYRLLLLEGGIGGYVSRKLSIPAYLSNAYTERHFSPLCFVLGMAPRPSDFELTSTNVNPWLLEKLLRSGCNPNKVYGGVTFWSRFVSFYTSGPRTSTSTLIRLAIALESGIWELMLRHGADPVAYVRHTSMCKVPFWLLLLLLGPDIPISQWPGFERVWGLTIERIPALSQAKCLTGFWSTSRDEKLEGLRNFDGDMTNHKVLIDIFARIVNEVRDDRAALEQCMRWFGHWLLSKEEELNSKKRSRELERDDEGKRSGRRRTEQ